MRRKALRKRQRPPKRPAYCRTYCPAATRERDPRLSTGGWTRVHWHCLIAFGSGFARWYPQTPLIETLAPNRTDEAFGGRILPGRSRRTHDRLDAHAHHPLGASFVRGMGREAAGLEQVHACLHGRVCFSRGMPGLPFRRDTGVAARVEVEATGLRNWPGGVVPRLREIGRRVFPQWGLGADMLDGARGLGLSMPEGKAASR